MAYKKEHGDANPKYSYKTPDGVNLGTWLDRQRAGKKADTLSRDREERLTALGVVWEVGDANWDAKWDAQYDLLVAYKKEHGDANPIQRYKTPDGVSLGTWLNSQRAAKRADTLSRDREERLTALGVAWNLGSGFKVDAAKNPKICSIVAGSGMLRPLQTRHPLLARRYCAATEADKLLDRQYELIARLGTDRPAFPGLEAAPDNPGRRRVYDGVASESECHVARAAAMRAMMRACDTDGDRGRLFPADANEARPLLGREAFDVLTELRGRIGRVVAEAYGDADVGEEAELREVGSLISWISGPDDEESGSSPTVRCYSTSKDQLWGTFAPHVDKANIAAYDISALLYLSTAAVDFAGGLFAFNDPDADRLVEPVAGRLIVFDSGFENLHQVRPVFSGDRLLLSVWYNRLIRD